MPEIPQGTPQPSEQPGNGTPNPEQAALQPGQQPESQPVQPSAEQLQAQLEQERQQREHWESQYKALQPEYTRTRQALAQVAGGQYNPNPQPPPDPMATVMAKYGKSFGPESIQAVGEIVQALTSDVRQQNQFLQQQLAATQQASQLDYSLAQAAQLDPSLFQNQAVYEQTRQQAMALASQGGQINPQLLRDIAVIQNYHASKASPPAQPAPYYPPQPAPTAAPSNPFARGMFQVQPGYPPPQPTQRPVSGVASQLQAEIESRYPKKP